jgi:hypothetical protein
MADVTKLVLKQSIFIKIKLRQISLGRHPFSNASY